MTIPALRSQAAAPGWMSRSKVLPLAVVRGGSQRDLVDLIARNQFKRFLIVCTNTTAFDFAMDDIADFDAQAPKSIMVSRGLIKDVEIVSARSTADPVLFCADVVTRYVEDERERLKRQTTLLAGYDLSDTVLTLSSAKRVGERMVDIAERVAFPIVFHDKDAIIPSAVLGKLTVFQYPIRELPNRSRDLSLDLISPAPILDHARFLVETQLADLMSLHGVLAGSDPKPVFAAWDEHLAALQSQHKSLISPARQLLATLQERLTSGF